MACCSVVFLFFTVTVQAAVTNSVPWSDSFESYALGTVLQATNGWSSTAAVAGVVTNPAGPLDALTSGYAPGLAYPLPTANHTKLAAITDLVDNNIHSTTGSVVVLDVVALPTWSDMEPYGKPEVQYALYIKTNQHVAIWQHSLIPATNTWLELTGTMVNTGVWTRFTILQNYSNSLYQVRLNGGAPISDPSGYKADGVTLNGPWFHMVQTNGVMAKVTLGDGGTNYVDDFVVTNRTLSWAPTGWTEGVTNNGTIDNSTPVTVTLLYDTFKGNVGDDFTSYVQVDSGLPPGLSLVARLASATTVELTLTNAASNHAASYSGPLTVHFKDSAFTLGNAADVSGYSNAALAVTFHDAAILSYSATQFTEASPPNDGSINNTPPVTITLTNDTFTGSDNEDYATNTAKLVISGMPTGLTGQVVKVDARHLQMMLLGKAAAHYNFNSTNFTLTFQGAAFTTNIVTGSASNGTTAIQVLYVTAPALAYSTTTFSELTMGTINNGTPMTITLSGDTFVAVPGGDFSSHVTVNNLPPGLTAVFTRDSATQLSVTLTGAAVAHGSINTTTALGFTFNNGAFLQASLASQVIGYATNNLNVVFINDTYYINNTPYRESFEEYANGLLLAWTNGWTADYYADAAQVTNAASAMSLLPAYASGGRSYPITTNHTQALLLRDSIRDEIHSPAGAVVYLDFLMLPVAVIDPPAGNTNLQFAFYVNTNRQLVVWHRNFTATPTNEWRVLTNNAPMIDTNAWSRFTVSENYSNMMFQLQVNEGVPVSDPVGWDVSGTIRTGSWFHMVNTNANTMSQLGFNGVGTAYVDDLTVVTTLPSDFGGAVGSVFKIR
ncbi:MAG: hypothetical protein WCS52_00595 [bacterium]